MNETHIGTHMSQPTIFRIDSMGFSLGIFVGVES